MIESFAPVWSYAFWYRISALRIRYTDGRNLVCHVR